MSAIGHPLKMAAFVALFAFSLYLIRRQPEPSRPRLYSVQALIMVVYFAGQILEDL